MNPSLHTKGQRAMVKIKNFKVKILTLNNTQLLVGYRQTENLSTIPARKREKQRYIYLLIGQSKSSLFLNYTQFSQKREDW